MQLLTKLVVSIFFITFLYGCDSSSESKKVITDEIDLSLCQFEKGPCKLDVNDVSVHLLINPTFTPSEKPLTIALNFSQVVKDVTMRIEGRDMFMGIIPVTLKTINNRSFEGTAIYGSCSSDYMVWRALVNFTINGEKQSTWFDFLADNKR